MLQAVVKKGKVVAEQVPAPLAEPGEVLIQVQSSCISAGTEMAGVKQSGKSLVQKAIEQPDKIRKALNLAFSQGLDVLRKKTQQIAEEGRPTGYSISGVVLEVGAGVEGIFPGDSVAAAGAGLANHAEFVSVPAKLVVPMPKGLDFELASTVTLGGIAMQGVRRADLRLGELAVVMGAGILGLLAVQLLRGAGVRVAALDLDRRRLELAEKLGAELCLLADSEDLQDQIRNWSGGHGADAVLFAAATQDSHALAQAFRMSKRKGRVVLVGTSGMEIDREDIYPKELDFLVSTSYGPGRYDPNYEEKGLDYPYAYVRWTENRNMAEYLRLLAIGQVKLDGMIDGRYDIDQVEKAFAALESPERPLLLILNYPQPTGLVERSFHFVRRSQRPGGVLNVGLVGAGNFAKAVHVPLLKQMPEAFHLRCVHSSDGLRAKNLGQELEVDYVTTDYSRMLYDEQLDLVLICTRHGNHARLALQALQAGKHVFVEKPLATTETELAEIERFYADFPAEQDPPVLFVGFNRRFSPFARVLRKHARERRNPLFINYRVNAGHFPAGHWVHEHGGRMVGEVCHLIDMACFLAQSKVAELSVQSLSPTTEHYSGNDNKAISLRLEDGSVCSIQYFAVGSPLLGKELLELHFDGKSLVVDDYKRLRGYGLFQPEINSENALKGHAQEWARLHKTLSGQMPAWPITLAEMLHATRVSFLLNPS